MTHHTKLYLVVYRVGGTVDFEWRRSVPTPSLDQAQQAAAAVRRGGRPAHVEDAQASYSIGLPETFDADTPLDWSN